MPKIQEKQIAPSTEIEYWRIYAVARDQYDGFWVPGRMITPDSGQVWEVHPQPGDPLDEDDKPIPFKCGRALLHRAINTPHGLVAIPSTKAEFEAAEPVSKRKSVEERLTDALDQMKIRDIEHERALADLKAKYEALLSDDAKRGKR